MPEFNKNARISRPTTVISGSPSTYRDIDIDKFSRQLGENLYGELPSLYQQRAEAQTFGESVGNFWARGLSKAVLSIPETLGHIMNIPGWIAGDEDFNNALSEWARSTKESLDEDIFPEYSRDIVDGAEFKPWNLGWWARNGDSVVESLGYFVPGMLAGKLVGATLKGSQAAVRMAKGLQTFKGLNTADKIANAGSVVTATMLSNHAEGMQIAAQTYSDVLGELTEQGVDEVKAKDLAHKAATKASLGNYAMILTDIPQFKLMFKGFDDIRRGANFSKSWAKRNLPELLKQSMFEGGEELYQGMLEREAKRSAEIEAGVKDDDGSGLMERFFDYAASPEGLTEGFLGAMGGLAFGGLFGGLQMQQNKLDRINGLGQIQRQADTTRRLLARNEEVLRKADKGIDTNNALAVDSAIESVFRNQAWAAAELGTYTQLEEFLDMVEQADDAMLKKEGWSREEVQKRLPKFRKILQETEDIHNTVQNLSPSASSDYKAKMATHLLKIESANSSIEAARARKVELLRNAPEAPEEVPTLTFEEAIDLKSKIDSLSFLARTAPDEKTKEVYEKQKQKLETKLNTLIADNPTLTTSQLSLDPLNNIRLFQANIEESSNELNRQQNTEDFEFFSKEENRKEYEKEVQETRLKKEKRDIAQLIVNKEKLDKKQEKVYEMYKEEIDELVVTTEPKKQAPKTESKKEAPKKEPTKSKVQEDPDVKKEKARKANAEAEKHKAKEQAFSDAYDAAKATLDEEIAKLDLPASVGNKEENILYQEDSIGTISIKLSNGNVEYKVKKGSRTTSPKNFEALILHIRTATETRKKQNSYTVVPNKPSEKTPLSPEEVSVVRQGEIIEFEKDGIKIYFQKIDKIDDKFEWIYSIVNDKKLDFTEVEDSIREQAANIKRVLETDNLPAEWEASKVTNLKGKEEELPPSEEVGNDSAAIDKERIKFWEEWAARKAEKTNNENKPPKVVPAEKNAQTTLNIINSETGQIEDNANLDVEFLYSPIEEPFYQLEVDMNYQPETTHSWMSLPIVLIAPQRRESSDNKQGGRLGHLPVIIKKDGYYDIKQGNTNTSFNIEQLNTTLEGLKNTPDIDKETIEYWEALKARKLAEIAHLISLRKLISESTSITTSDKKNITPLQVTATKKSGGIINNKQNRTSIRSKFEPNDPFNLGVSFTFGIGRSEVRMSYGVDAEGTQVQNLGVISENVTRGGVYLISHPNPNGNYVPININKKAVAGLSEEHQQVVLEFVLEQVERFKNSGTLTTGFKEELDSIEDALSQLFMVTRSQSQNGHGQIVLDTQLKGKGESRVNGAYFAIRNINGKGEIEEHRFYYRTNKDKSKDSYRDTPKGKFNYQLYVNGVKKGNAIQNVDKTFLLTHMQNLKFDLRLDLINQPGEYTAPVNFGQGVGTYNDFIAEFLLASDALIVKKGEAPFKPQGFSTVYANPYFVINNATKQTPTQEVEDVKVEAKKADIEKTLYGTISGSIALSQALPNGIYIDLGNGLFAYADKNEKIAAIVDKNNNYLVSKSFWNDVSKKWQLPNLANLKDDAKKLGIDEAAYIKKYQDAVDGLNSKYGAELNALEKLLETDASQQQGKDKADVGDTKETEDTSEVVLTDLVIPPAVQERLKTLAESEELKEEVKGTTEERLKTLESLYKQHLRGEKIPGKVRAKFRLYGKSFVAKGTATTRIARAEAIAWFKQRFPDLEVSFVEGLINNGVGTSWGMFINDMVILSDRAQAGVEYHEAFHAAFNMYTSPRRRAKILEEARRKFGIPSTKEVDEFKKENDVEGYNDSEIRDFILEEKMAEEYRAYESARIQNNKTAKLPILIQKFFNAIFDFIAHIFNKPAYMNRLYKNISAGNVNTQRIYKSHGTRNLVVSPLHPVFSPVEEAEILNVFSGLYLQRWVENEYDFEKTDYTFREEARLRNYKEVGAGSVAIKLIDKFTISSEQSENWDVVFETLDPVNNYPGILARVKETLRKKINVNVEELDAKDFTAGVSKTYDTAFLAFNPTENVSRQIKSMFSMMLTNETSPILGVPMYAKFNEIFPALHRRLANIPEMDNKVIMLYNVLEKFKDDFDLSDTVSNMMNLLTTNQNLRAKFFQTFNKYTHNQMRTIIEANGTIKNEQVTSNNFQKELVDRWAQEFYYSIEQELRAQNKFTPKEKVEAFKKIGAQLQTSAIEAFKAINKATTEEDLSKAVDKLVDTLDILKVSLGKKEAVKAAIVGYISNPIVLQAAAEALKNTPNNTDPVRLKKYALANSKSPIGDRVFSGKSSLSSTLLSGKSVFSGEMEGLLRGIAEVMSLEYLEKYDNTALTLTGEKYWVINHPTPLSVFLSEITERLKEFDYLEFSNWLSEFKANPSKFVSFMHQGVYNDRNPSEYENMTDVERSTTSIALFLDSYLRESSDHSRFLLDLPFEADKTRHEVLSVPKYVSSYSKDGKFIFDVNTNQAFAAFVNTVKQERALMEKWNALLDKYFEFDGNTIVESSITNENRKFLIEPLLVVKKDGKYVRNVKPSFITDTTSSPEVAAKNFIIEATKAQLDAFIKEGFIVRTSNGLQSNFIDNRMIASYGSIDKIVTDFVVNTTIGLREFKLYMSGVDQFYGASAKENKRMAQYGTPASTLFVEGGVNEFYGNLVINDIIESVDEETLSKIKERTGWNDSQVQHYLNLTTNDGQGWATLGRFEEILEGLGESIENDKQREAFNRLKAGEALSFDDYTMLSVKGFYYRLDYIPELGIHVPQQIKYNLYPLAPQFTTGLKLDAVRKKAEELEQESGVKVEIIPESAFKVGTRGMIPVTNIEDATSASLVKLKNNGWGKQQENPVHADNYAQKLGVQIAKLMLSNINPEAIYELPFEASEDVISESISNKTKRTVNGQQLIIEASRIIAEIVREQVEEFKENLADAAGNITDVSLAETLERAFLKEDKPYNLLEMLRTSEEFSLPLGAHPSLKEIEPLLKSMFNNLRKIPMPGHGYIQLSDALVEDDGTVPKNSAIQWLDSKQDKKLGVYIVDDVVYVEALISIGKNGLDGVRDINQIERDAPEMLRRIGYRIPTSGKSYTVVIKTVGFIENTVAAETVVLPFALMANMGYDFDVDKLYVMRRKAKVMEDKTLKVIDRPSENGKKKYMLTNRLLDVYEAIYNSKHHAVEIFASGEFKKMEEISAKYDISNTNLNTNTYAGQRALNKRNMDGVSLKGIFAGANGFIPIAQISNMRTSIPVRVEKDGEIIKLNQFGKIGDSFYNIEGELITEVTGMFVNAIMDIVKKPTTALNNITTYNANVAITLAALGLDYEHIAAFMTSPAVVNITRINESPENSEFAPTTIAKQEFLRKFGFYKLEYLNTFLGNKGIKGWEEKSTSPISLEKLAEYKENPLGKIPSDKNKAKQYLLDNLEELEHYWNTLVNFTLYKKNATAFSDASNVLSGDKANDSLLIEIHKRNELKDVVFTGILTTEDKFGEVYDGVEGVLGPNSSFEAAKAFWEIDQLALEILGKSSRLFTEREDYRHVFNKIKELFKLTTKDEEALYKNFKTAATASLNSQNPFFQNLDYQYYLSQDFISKFLPIKDKALKQGFTIFNSLVVEYSETEVNKNGGIPFIKFKNTELDSVQKDEYTNQLKNILEEGDEDIADFVVELIKYQFITTGFTTTINSFSHIIPADIYYDSVMKISETLNELSKLEAVQALGENFVIDFIKHNAQFLPKLPKHTPYPNINGEVVKVPAKKAFNKSFFKKTLLTNKDGVKVFQTQIFARMGIEEDNVIYARIDSKGVANKVFEYGVEDTNIPENKAGKTIEEVMTGLKKLENFRFTPITFDMSENVEETSESEEFEEVINSEVTPEPLVLQSPFVENKTPEQVLSEAIASLPEEEKKAIEEVKAEEAPEVTTEEFVKNEVLKANVGEKNNSKISKIIDKIRKILLSTMIVFSAWFGNSSLVIPTQADFASVEQIYTDESTSLVDKVKEYHSRNHSNESFMIVSKGERMLIAYDNQGNQILNSRVLIGENFGDTTNTALKETLPYSSKAFKAAGQAITPSGVHRAKKYKDTKYGAPWGIENAYKYSLIDQFNKVQPTTLKDGTLVTESGPAVHININHPARQNPYSSSTNADNNITMGCIGMNPESFAIIDDHMTSSLHVYVIPEGENKQFFDEYLLYSDVQGGTDFKDYLKMKDAYLANEAKIKIKYPDMGLEDIALFTLSEFKNFINCL